MDGLVFGDRYHVYPQGGDKTLIIAKEGSVTAFDIWFETEADCRRAIESLTDDEKAALCCYPQGGDKTLIIAKEGSVTAFDIWFETEADCRRAIESLTDDEKAALCWMGENE